MAVETLEKKVVKQYSLEEYLKLEEKAAYKSEFRNGKIVKMAGGSYEHSAIHLAVSALLFIISLKRKNLQIFNSDQKVYLPKYNQSVYPDVSAVLGQREMYKGNQALLNPTLIIEVLSDSTERYDRGSKFRKYQSIPSFQEYVLIDQHTPVIDILTKEKDGWLMKTYIGLEDEIYFKSIDATLKMADIYQEIDNLKDPQTAFDFTPDEEE